MARLRLGQFQPSPILLRPVVASLSPAVKRLLGRTVWTTGSRTVASVTSATPADVNAALAVTFTVPQSGEVLVCLTAYTWVGWNTVESKWCLRDGSTTVPGTIQRVSNNIQATRVSYRAWVDGLTPGEKLTWKWGAVGDGTDAAILAVGPDDGPAIMEVWG